MKKNKLLRILFTFILCASTGCNSNSNETTPETVFVTFKDFDDSVLYHGKVPYGNVATYVGDIPVRDMTIDTVYTFSGWDKNVDQPLYDNTIFKAKYSEDVRKYVVNFNNYDGTLLQRVNVEYGSTAKYSKLIPTKQSNDEHIEYTFSGWDKNVDSFVVTTDTTFTAQFSVTEYIFATFNNYDGTQLLCSKIVKGESANYTGTTPIKSCTEKDKAYKFSGWDKPLDNLYSDTTFTALFDLKNIYTVTFKNYDGCVLSTSKVVEGDTAVYTGSTPYRASTQSGNYKYTYTFNGWDKSLTNVTSSFTTTAQFTSTSKYYNQKYETALQTIRNNATSYDSSTGLYYKGFGLNVSSSYMETGYGEYNPSTDVVDLYYAATTADNGACIIIYFDLHEPGTYYCTYAYSLNGTKLVMAMFNIYSSWSSSSSVSFSSITNLSSNSDSSHRQMASNLITTCLTRASNTNWIDTYNLGFTNF